ncbi:hypothetical protein CERSUDRAFT_96997 [Gelatoporia subvermispora B]|uniref:Uncharacterized protein n=1 Tax=Ceriporiopsis subvermispora (strain B) TaxID=914234 RepID=M2QSS0_CERS8|nr:hypothetical protein CERSUDRAFT_96997 [Gelatoporia subvermispora B]
MSENLTQDDEVTDPSHERSFVQPDEFVVTVLGLPAMLSPEYIFSGVFGLTPLPRFWSIPGLAQTPTEPPAFDFYVPDNEGTVGAARPKFYSCDRLVSYGPRMCYLGINYSGRLEFSADGVVALRGPLYEKYKVSLSAAADGAFRANPELAQELAWDILSDTGEDDGTIGRVLRPANMEGAEAYRTAFDAAWRKRDTKLTPEDRLYPYVDEKEMDLVDEFDLVGVRVLPHVRIILERSGAFPDIKDYARSLLLQAPVSTKVQETPGYDRMKRGMVSLLPDATEDRISMRLFEHRYPQVVWDEATKTIIVREPDPCLDHAEGSRCMCWVGPYLHEAAEDYCNVRADASGSGEPSLRSMFRAFLQCMNGVADMRDVSSDHMDIHDAEVVLSHLQPTVDEDDDNELGYVTPEPRAAPVIEQSLQADGTPISTVSAVVGDEHEATPPVEAAEFVLGSGLEYPQASPHTPQAMSTDPAEDEHPGIDTEEHCVDEETLENLVPGVEGDPRQLPVGDLLLYCGGLIQFRVTKELQAAGQRIALLTEEQARLEDSLAEHVKAEEDLKATLDSRLAEFADFQRDLELKDGLLREKEALIAALKQSLRVQDERIKKLEATVRQQEGRLLEKKRKAMEAIEKLFGGPDEAQNTEDEEDQLEEERPPRKLLRTANGTSSQPGSPSTLLTPRRKVVNGVATPVRSSGSPRNLLSSVPASRQKPRHAISPAYTDQE